MLAKKLTRERQHLELTFQTLPKINTAIFLSKYNREQVAIFHRLGEMLPGKKQKVWDYSTQLLSLAVFRQSVSKKLAGEVA